MISHIYFRRNSYIIAILICSFISSKAESKDVYKEFANTIIFTDSIVIQKINITMSDGVKLACDLYLPNTNESYPTILHFFPYNSNQPGIIDVSKRIASRGYAVLVQNQRGKYGSEGVYLPFDDSEIQDFIETLKWVKSQDWCNKKIGLYGNSSSSYNAQKLAAAKPDEIDALVNISGLTNTEELFFPGGAFRLNTLYPWLAYNYAGKDIEDWENAFKDIPVSKQMPWDVSMLYRMASSKVKTKNITSPTLHITGWNDVVYRQSFFLNRDIKIYNDIPQKMIVGAWAHNYDGETTKFGDIDFGPKSKFSVDDEMKNIIEWYDTFLKKKGKNTDTTNEFFIMGLNKWVSSKDWPVSKRESQKLFLTHNGELKKGNLGEKNILQFSFNPEDPVETYGGVNSHVFPDLGPKDQSRFLNRKDILKFKSDIMSKDTYILGKMNVILNIKSNAVDTDFTAKLMVKRNDGMLRIIEDGIVRVSRRNGLYNSDYIDPDDIYQLKIDLGWSGIEIKKGERLVLHISSSNFPKYDINYNSGMDPLISQKSITAEQTVITGGENASHLYFETVSKDFIERNLLD